jgi:phosphatidate cytidylyltransferase
MFKQRVASAVVMVAVFLALLASLSATDFSLVIMLVVMVAGWEWANFLKLKGKVAKVAYLVLLLALLLGAASGLGLWGEFNFALSEKVSLVAVGLWAVIFLWIQGYPSSAILWSPKPLLGLLGLLLLVATWVAVAAITHSESGQWLLLLAILIVVLADCGGYIAGNLFGRHKLAPVVSPGKTWEGFAGGMFLQLLLIAGLIWYDPQLDPVALSIIILSVALYSVLGDLFESMVKRHSGVKDSGQLLPGHGGVLDRIDGIMAALPLFALMLPKTSAL